MNTFFFFGFSNFSGTSRMSQKNPGISRQKSLVSLGFERHTELFGPHPFTWKTPTPPQRALRSKKFNPDRKFQSWLEIFNLDRKFQSQYFCSRGASGVQKSARSKNSIHDRSLAIFNPEGCDRIFQSPGPLGPEDLRTKKFGFGFLFPLPGFVAPSPVEQIQDAIWPNHLLPPQLSSNAP